MKTIQLVFFLIVSPVLAKDNFNIPLQSALEATPSSNNLFLIVTFWLVQMALLLFLYKALYKVGTELKKGNPSGIVLSIGSFLSLCLVSTIAFHFYNQ